MTRISSIISYIAERIKTVDGFSDENVFKDRYVGNSLKHLPAVCIYHISTERERETFDGEHSCISQVLVELYSADGDSTVTDQINQIGQLIATAIESFRDFEGLVFNSYISLIEDIFDENTDSPLGVRSHTVTIDWLQQINN